MAEQDLLRIRVTLKGRPVRTHTLTKDRVSVGRNPAADVFLDNPGVSREHVLLTRTPRGTYVAEDLGSANGTLINDAPLTRHELMNNDVIHVGKFALWVTYEADRRSDTGARRLSATADEGTTVLSAQELEDMLGKLHQAEDRARTRAPAAVARPAGRGSRGRAGALLLVALVGFLIGSVAGAGAALYLTR